jgi:hypothetical protein
MDRQVEGDGEVSKLPRKRKVLLFLAISGAVHSAYAADVAVSLSHLHVLFSHPSHDPERTYGSYEFFSAFQSRR